MLIEKKLEERIEQLQKKLSSLQKREERWKVACERAKYGFGSGMKDWKRYV